MAKITNAQLSKIEKFDFLYKNYYKYVYKISYGVIKNDRIMDDTIQDVYMKLWNCIDKINIHDTVGTKYFISVVAKNTAINKYKREKKDKTQFVGIDNDILFATNGDKSADPSEIVINDDNVNYIYNKIDELGEKYSEVMTLKYKYDLTPEEIASLTELSIKTVYTKLSRGRELLKSKLFEQERRTDSEKSNEPE